MGNGNYGAFVNALSVEDVKEILNFTGTHFTDHDDIGLLIEKLNDAILRYSVLVYPKFNPKFTEFEI